MLLAATTVSNNGAGVPLRELALVGMSAALITYLATGVVRVVATRAGAVSGRTIYKMQRVWATPSAVSDLQLLRSTNGGAAWAVLAQRLRIVVAARLRRDLIERHGDEGAFPAPSVLRGLDLDLPGRKAEYLHAVADAALDGSLDGGTLHHADPVRSVVDLQRIRGIGPFAAELIDRFGKLPEETENLLSIIETKLNCRAACVAKLDAGPKGALVAFHEDRFPDVNGLIAYVDRLKGTAKLRPDNKLVITRDWASPRQQLHGALQLSKGLAKILA